MWRSCVALAAGLLLQVSGASALERRVVATEKSDGGEWVAGSTCSISYYNNCTGWIWVWSYGADHVVGATFDPCCSNATLVATQTYFWDGAPPGYGLTGVLEIHTADQDGAPQSLLGSQSHLPSQGPSLTNWGIRVTGPVVVTYQFRSDSYYDYFQAVLASDHPGAGPTGPQACGFCYPSTRVPHSYYYGTVDTPLRPGRLLDRGACFAEWYGWGAYFSCQSPVEPTSWSSIKALYR